MFSLKLVLEKGEFCEVEIKATIKFTRNCRVIDVAVQHCKHFLFLWKYTPLQLIDNTLLQEHVRNYFTLKASKLKMSSKRMSAGNNSDKWGNSSAGSSKVGLVVHVFLALQHPRYSWLNAWLRVKH